MFNYIGIDVSKATLQVYIPITDENISIENSKKAQKRDKTSKKGSSLYRSMLFVPVLSAIHTIHI